MGNLEGTFKLTSIQAEFADNGERVDVYGDNPLGFLIHTNGRMMAVITRSDRSAGDSDANAASLFRTMMAYSGEYTIEGSNAFSTKIDVAWHPAWLGQVQSRTYMLEGDALTIRTGEVTHPAFPGRKAYGIITWRKV